MYLAIKQQNKSNIDGVEAYGHTKFSLVQEVAEAGSTGWLIRYILSSRSLLWTLLWSV